MARVLIYGDAGTGTTSRSGLVLAFHQHLGSSAEVELVTADTLTRDDAWQEDALVIAFPGGADLPYCERLNGRGNASIRRFVSQGGRYLGMCAGAYYAARHVVFEADGPWAIEGPRELAFFAGSAIGSQRELAGPYRPGAPESLGIASLKREDGREDADILYWGGPRFEPDDDCKRCRALAWYRDLPGPPIAAVRCEVGRGAAVLCGAHAEIFSTLLLQDPIADKLSGSDLPERLERGERARRDFLADLLRELLNQLPPPEGAV